MNRLSPLAVLRSDMLNASGRHPLAMSRLLNKAAAKRHYHVAWKKLGRTRRIPIRDVRSLSTTGGGAFTPWETYMVESDGDYRDEAYLEDHIGGPLYANQQALPRLPVPTIEETLAKFLPTALPLAKSKAESDALVAASEAFPDQAKILQERLIDRMNNEMNDSSWLQLWWNQLAYLQFRGSVVVNVSYFFQFEDDPTTEIESSLANVQRAATLLYATGEFRKMVCSGALPKEKIGKNQDPLCSTPFKYMFNACRIPKSVQDSYRIYDPSRHAHAIVARKGHFFAIDIVHPETNEPLALSVLEDQLKQCIDLADSFAPDQMKFGLLTSSNRDTWTEARDKLLKAGGVEMEKALEKLESSAVLLSLDDGSPVSREECAENLLTGGKLNGENRWFDKSIQLLVAENGKSGILGEHSMMDGMVLVSYADHLMKTSYKDTRERSTTIEDGEKRVVNIFEKAAATVDAKLASSLMQDASKQFEVLREPQSITTHSFQGYGGDYMKKAGHSPDAYVQMAMQLATYRLFGEQVGTYEATQVRPFLHGRTETTRAVSTQSGAFIKAMGLRPKMDEVDPGKRKEKLDLFKQATATHSKYTATAAQAQGVDRHFFGLSTLVQGGEQTPDLLSDPVFVRSKTWRLSTSHLTHPSFLNWGFGQVAGDGVGVGYSIHPQSCIFNISSLVETGWTVQLSDLLEEALLEMQRLVEHERAAGADLPR